MVEALRCLLDGVFDYAGVFPPAKLDLPIALSNYLEYRRREEKWMVGRFACSAPQLPELRELALGYALPLDIAVTVIGQGSQSLEEWESRLEQDAAAMSSFLETTEGIRLESYEVRLPDHDKTELYVRDLHEFGDVDIFIELPWGDGMDDSLAVVAEAEWPFVKARAGGATPRDFPPAAALAGFIHGAISLDLGFKLTAGLHHALRRVDQETGAHAHGFLNVLGASALAIKEDLSRSEVEQVLMSASIRDWRFEDRRLRWQDSTLTIDDLDFSRDALLAIGTCSIDEGLTELDSFGLLSGDM